MADYDLVIRGGNVVDGLRNDGRIADVAIRDGLTVGIGSYAAHEGKRTIDADGLLVTPGFVDLHTHDDSQVYWDPYCTISGWHGVTSDDVHRLLRDGITDHFLAYGAACGDHARTERRRSRGDRSRPRGRMATSSGRRPQGRPPTLALFRPVVGAANPHAPHPALMI